MKFKTQNPKLKTLLGFTLIELLVVITLISILAVAVLAAINPIEQRRKAQDTSAEAAATELMGALDRYYASYGCYPWNGGSAGTCTGGVALATGYSSDARAVAVSPGGLLRLLVTSGEIKANLLDRIAGAIPSHPLYTLRINEEATNDAMHLCYTPTSSANQQVANNASTRYNTSFASCTTNCAICIPDTIRN